MEVFDDGGVEEGSLGPSQFLSVSSGFKRQRENEREGRERGDGLLHQRSIGNTRPSPSFSIMSYEHHVRVYPGRRRRSVVVHTLPVAITPAVHNTTVTTVHTGVQRIHKPHQDIHKPQQDIHKPQQDIHKPQQDTHRAPPGYPQTPAGYPQAPAGYPQALQDIHRLLQDIHRPCRVPTSPGRIRRQHHRIFWRLPTWRHSQPNSPSFSPSFRPWFSPFTEKGLQSSSAMFVDRMNICLTEKHLYQIKK
ncbi:hypothetical protein Hamer_G026486 [Homarus americanus]|uniref:Uncharacterized protein n=1 Tax=Homarus americanus TaxID=6706 RepID=A0A8J5KF02_HOMAM|nr:hypothetical protein Hamer_G026486 [Homarus americanus]